MPRAGVMRAFFVAAILMSAATHTNAVPKKSKRVVYVIAFGNFSERAETEIQRCCGLNKAINITKATPTTVQTGNSCPDNVLDEKGGRIIACEILQLHESNDRFWISNELRPAEPEQHVVMMTAKDPIEYTSKDPSQRLDELMDNLKSLINCHEFYHEGPRHPPVGDGACDWCAGKQVKAPGATEMSTGKP